MFMTMTEGVLTMALRFCVPITAAPGALSLRQRLAGLGLTGVVAYGLLNTLYYTAAFYFVWTYVARVPRGGYRACVISCACMVDSPARPGVPCSVDAATAQTA